MKKFLVAMALTASLAGAKDMTGRFGLGSSTTLGGVTGLAVQYQLSKFLTVEPIFSMAMTDGEADWGLGLSGFLNLADMENANLLLGLTLNVTSSAAAAVEDHPMGMSVSIPIRPVIFFNDRIAAHVSTGLDIDFMQPGADTPAADHESTTIITLGGHLFGNAGVTFYF